MSLQSDWHDAALIGHCLFDVGTIDQMSTLTPAPPMYRRPGLDTASFNSAKYRRKKEKQGQKKIQKKNKKRS